MPLVHGVPSDTVGVVQFPLGSHMPLAWHWSIAGHRPGSDPVHMPAEHVYLKHFFDPLQEVPSAAGGLEHCPVVCSHVPATWQPSLAVQVTEATPVHVPPWQEYESHLFIPVH